MSFLLSEDEALRNLLKDITVTDQKLNGTRSVGVWFGQPDQEVRSQSYPYITIDMIDLSEDVTRAMRGRAKPLYLADPTNMVDATGSDPAVEFDPQKNSWDIPWPIPVNIDYQITTYARQPRHDRQLLATLLYTKIPLRFAVLNVGNNDAQGTLRRIDVLDISKRDITEEGKRLFVNAITVRISSEIAPSTFNRLYKTLELNVTGVTDDQGGTDVSHSISRTQFTAINPFTISIP